MCYKSSLIVDLEFLEDRYQVKRSPKLKGEPAKYQSFHFNGFAHPNMLIIPQQNTEVLSDAYWGLMPKNEKIEDRNAYYKKAARYGGGLNARSEKVFDHFLYKQSIYEQRCIVPLSGFYEPHKGPEGSYPFYFKDKGDEILSVAGLYSITQDGGVTYTLLTKEASPLFKQVHNTKERQIVLMDKVMEKEWLNPDLAEDHINEILHQKYDDSTLITFPVTKKINSNKYHLDNEDIIKPVDFPELKSFLQQLNV